MNILIPNVMFDPKHGLKTHLINTDINKQLRHKHSSTNVPRQRCPEIVPLLSIYICEPT